MDATEAKVRCLELAATMCRPHGLPIAKDVVEIATSMYDYVNAPPKAPETGSEVTQDKPEQVVQRSRKARDILS